MQVSLLLSRNFLMTGISKRRLGEEEGHSCLKSHGISIEHYIYSRATLVMHDSCVRKSRKFGENNSCHFFRDSLSSTRRVSPFWSIQRQYKETLGRDSRVQKEQFRSTYSSKERLKRRGGNTLLCWLRSSSMRHEVSCKKKASKCKRLTTKRGQDELSKNRCLFNIDCSQDGQRIKDTSI